MGGLRDSSDGDRGLPPRFGAAARAGLIALAALLMIQPACLFKKKKPKADVPQVLAAPIRLALLPLNAAPEGSDPQWVALAVPAMLAKAAQTSQDLELVPLWESMPVTLESAGDTRAVTAEAAAYVASRVSAKWGVFGEVSASKGGIDLQIDFVPVKATSYAFRYSRSTDVGSVPADCYEAVVEFLRYQVARPPGKFDPRSETSSMKQLAETINQEYGWFMAAAPGKSETAVESLGQVDNRLARVLFSPILYKSLGPPPEAPKAATSIPSRTRSPAPTETATPGVASAQPESKSPPAPPTIPGTAEFEKFTPPPPQTFSQMLPALQAPAAKPIETSAEPAKPGSKKSESGPKTEEKKGVRIQVFASQSQKEAEEMAAKLQSWGYAAGVEQVDLADKGIWYRIRLLPFRTRKEAVEAGEKMLSENLIKGYWIVP